MPVCARRRAKQKNISCVCLFPSPRPWPCIQRAGSSGLVPALACPPTPVEENGGGQLCEGQDLVGCIDHGPGSNQPVHHLAIALGRRPAQRSRASQAFLRCEAGHGWEAEGRRACAAHWQHTRVLARHTHCPARLRRLQSGLTKQKGGREGETKDRNTGKSGGTRATVSIMAVGENEERESKEERARGYREMSADPGSTCMFE